MRVAEHDRGEFSRPRAARDGNHTGDARGTGDTDGNGIQDPGELGIDGVEVTLTATYADGSVNTFKTVEKAEEQILEGRAHVYLAGMVEVRFLALRHPDTIDVPVAEPLVAQSEGLAVARGEQELLNFLNTWVTARQTDKWLATTRDYWFESMTWALNPEE